jgi:hypothetical protein
VNVVSPSTLPPLPFDSSINKNDENDTFDENRLLSLVPKLYKSKAAELMTIFNSRGQELTWNSTGNVFVDQTSIPNSNIFEIFPLLYKVKKPVRKVPGLLEFISKLNEMGLGDYIVQKNLKKQMSKFEAPSDHTDVNVELANWWYIGP